MESLLQDVCDLAGFATVSREWQSIIEHNLARTQVTSSRFAGFESIAHRHRARVRYIWFCLELQEYDCTECAPNIRDMEGLNNSDNAQITTAFQRLFSTLSTWEPHGTLLLDISLHSPSHSEHCFKYLTFGPDIPIPPARCDWSLYEKQEMPAKVTDHQHGWIDGKRDSALSFAAILKVFDDIMGEGPFDTEKQEASVPVVAATANRRRWKPVALAQIFARPPRLEEIHYEPERDWIDGMQKLGEKDFQVVFKSLASRQLRKLVLFENFHQPYAVKCLECSPVRIPDFDVSRAVADASLKLEHLSASFLVDASHFFHAIEPSWKWPNLRSLALTSQVLAPDGDPVEMDDMLRTAAAAAVKMPKLETMEIWNGKEGSAMLFRY